MANQQGNQAVIRFLNQQVSNFSVLYIKLHRYHWYVQGENFFLLHEKFQEFYQEAAAYMDELAERVLAIGGRPLATMSKFIKEATIKEAEAENEQKEMLVELHEDYTQIAAELKEGTGLCEKHDDEPSADMLTDIQAVLEKHVWMLEMTMGKR